MARSDTWLCRANGCPVHTCLAQLRVQSKSGTATPRKKTMGCPRSTTASAALLYLAYYLRCCVKDLAVRSPAVGALAAHRMPAYLYRSNNDTKLLAHLARARRRRARSGDDERWSSVEILAPASMRRARRRGDVVSTRCREKS